MSHMRMGQEHPSLDHPQLSIKQKVSEGNIPAEEKGMYLRLEFMPELHLRFSFVFFLLARTNFFITHLHILFHIHSLPSTFLCIFIKLDSSVGSSDETIGGGDVLAICRAGNICLPTSLRVRSTRIRIRILVDDHFPCIVIDLKSGSFLPRLAVPTTFAT